MVETGATLRMKENIKSPISHRPNASSHNAKALLGALGNAIE